MAAKKPSAAKAKAAPKTRTKVAAKAKPKVAAKAKGKAAPKAKGKAESRRWVCRMCKYIYSEKIGEPQNGIKPGTKFEDLPDTYVCPVCGYTGKGKVGKWGFDEWIPTRFVCKVCGYIYDKARGEPHNGYPRGTAFEDLPESYACPICGIDQRITRIHGKVGKMQFEPLIE
jgi:rubredoxin